MLRHLSKIFSAAICLLVLAFSTSAKADVIYTTFGPGMSFGSTAWVIGSFQPPDANAAEEEIAASFVPNSDDTLDHIDLAAHYNQGINQLTVNLASDAAGVPGTILETWSFLNLSSIASVITADSIVHPLLAASSQYWVWLTADDLLNTNMGWNFNDRGDIGLDFRTRGGSWVAVDEFTPAFDVIGTSVPEPSTFLLLGAGLAGLGIMRRKLRK